ncbi:MAG: alcohol dehydrogenase catalytic domain-containing protein [Rhodospirillales bacterium]|nr:alcohol dehydrogenase catalytic domain-containing protein [Rhodospirillales bacterium]
MKALYYTATRETAFRNSPDPVAKAGEALMAVEAVGICGSDMHAWHGHDPRRVPPMILGHEAAGRVLEGPLAGQRVVVNPLISCGLCQYCSGGRSNLCPERELVGMRIPGAFAERLTLPARNLIPVPEGMDVAKAALTEPCATAWHAVALAQRSAWRPLAESRGLVIGGGSVGLLAALVLKTFGTVSVKLAETNALRRATASTAGIEAFDPSAEAAELDAFDLVVDAVGTVTTRAAAVAAVTAGGVIAHVGLQDWAGDFDARRVTLAEIAVLGVYTYTEADLRASLAALHSGRLGDLAWVEERPLAEGGQAFRDLDQGVSPAAKIVLRP